MMAMGISEEDFAVAWSVIDIDNSGTVSYKEFITFLITMKSSDTHFMLAYIKHYITWVKGTLVKQSDGDEHKLLETLERVEEKETAILEETKKQNEGKQEIQDFEEPLCWL